MGQLTSLGRFLRGLKTWCSSGAWGQILEGVIHETSLYSFEIFGRHFRSESGGPWEACYRFSETLLGLATFFSIDSHMLGQFGGYGLSMASIHQELGFFFFSSFYDLYR